MSRFLNKRFAALAPYTPGEQPQNRKYIKLNTNESPYPPSPRVWEAIGGEIEKLRLYSDPEVKQLSAAIAAHYGLAAEQIIVGNGSDEILAFAFQAFGGDVPLQFPAISYGFYPVFAQLFGIPAEQIPLTLDFQIDVKDYLACGRNIILANPNAPTGIYLELEKIERILQTNPNNLVIIDEAYVDFGGDTAIPLLKKYENLMVVQTFSKSRSLAGARLGFAAASKELVEDLNKMKFSFNPYNVNRLSILAGTAAMEDEAYFRQCTKAIVQTRERTVAQLESLGFTVLPSKANFLFAKSERIKGSDYFQKLRERGILVRHWDKPEILDFVRITIGTPQDMARFCQVTTEILAAQR